MLFPSNWTILCSAHRAVYGCMEQSRGKFKGTRDNFIQVLVRRGFVKFFGVCIIHQVECTGESIVLMKTGVCSQDVKSDN